MPVSQPSSFDQRAAVHGRGVAFFHPAVDGYVAAYHVSTGYAHRTCPQKYSTGQKTTVLDLEPFQSTGTDQSRLEESAGRDVDCSARWDAGEAARVVWLTPGAF